MQYRQWGSSDLRVSVVGLGTWAIGGGTVWGRDPDDAESIRTVQAALDSGVNLIDTAPAYGFGRSENVVGRAIRGRREQVLLATKCGLGWDDRRGSFHRHHGLRTDFLRGTARVMERVKAVEIDRDYRKKKEGLTPSEHAPVMAEI